MKVEALRRFLKAPDDVKFPVAAPAFLAVLVLVALVAAGIVFNEMVSESAVALFLAIAAVLATIAWLVSAGVSIDKPFPRPRTLLTGILAISLLALLFLFVGITMVDGPMSQDAARQRAYLQVIASRMERDGRLGQATMQRATAIDGAVDAWYRNEREAAASWGWSLLRRLPAVASRVESERLVVEKLARSRLELLSGDAPLWQATAQICADYRRDLPPGQRFQFDLRPGFERRAIHYSALLRREVKPEELMPLVPGGKCE